MAEESKRREENRQDLELVRDVFEEALSLPEEKRPALLDARCRGDAALRSEIEALLSSHAGLGGFLVDPLFRVPPLEDDVVQHAPAPLLDPGDTLDGYRIESFLARGGSGEVYRASQTSLSGRPVALKVMRVDGLRAKDRERFLAEARVASRIHHPHLVPVYGAGEDKQRGLFHYAMRLVEGPTLASVVESTAETGLPLEGLQRRQLVKRFHEVSSALASLHEVGLVHGDVKPANIVLEGGEGEPFQRPAMLVDLGLVRPAYQTVSTVYATPLYAAPELLLGKAIDARADVFSLGLVMHDLLAARSPNTRVGLGTDELARLSRIVPGIDPDLEAMVARAIDPDPDLRYASARALQSDLSAWLDGRPVAARRLEGLERLRRWARRNPWPFLSLLARSAAVTAASVLVLMGILWVGSMVTTAGRARDLWQNCRLARLPRALEPLPRILDRFLLPSELALLGDAFRDLTGDDPRVRVARTHAEEGPAASLRLVTAFLERDGAVAHPALARYLENALAGETASIFDPEDALREVTRLFYERPDASPHDAVSSAAFRPHLLRILESDPDPLRSLKAMTALSGCGTDVELRRLATLLVNLDDGPESVEKLRLGQRCIGKMIRRSHGGGFRAAVVAALDLETVLALRRRNEACRLGGRVIWSDLRGAASDLLRDLALARRAEGLDSFPIEEVGPSGEVSANLRAASRDPAQKEEILALASLPGDFPPSGYSSFGIGLVVGQFDDEDLERAVARCVDLEAERLGPDSPDPQESWEQGLAYGRGLLRGEDPEWMPDADTHAGERIDVELPPFRELAWKKIEGGSRDTVAIFDVVRRTCQGCTDGLGVYLRWPELEVDQSPGGGHVRLGAAGVSELRLTFRVPAVSLAGGQLRASIVLQKAVRGLLPYTGEAGLDVLFDGKALGMSILTTEGGLEILDIPLRRRTAESTLVHTLSLRLSRESTTTLRIHRIGIHTIDGIAFDPFLPAEGR